MAATTVTIDLRTALDWFITSDPWPLSQESNDAIETQLDAASREAGYEDWIVAFHQLPRPLPAVAA